MTAPLSMNENEPEKTNPRLRFMEIVTGIGVIGISSLVIIDTPDASEPRMASAIAFWLAGSGITLHGIFGSKRRPEEGDDNKGDGGGGYDPPPIPPAPSDGGLDKEVTDLTVIDIISASQAQEGQKILEPA